MPHRYDSSGVSVSSKHFKPRAKLFHALREKLKNGYTTYDLKSDLMSGLVVAMVAVPLSMALAIASGVPPQHGLYTAIIGGIVVAILGGSRFQVTGPTAAFVVILAPIAAKYGLAGLLTAGFIAGIMLWCMGMARMGKLVQFIPYPVITGFTSGIAIVIATIQLKDFFGLQIQSLPENFPNKVLVIVRSFPTISWTETSIGIATLILLLVWPKINKKIPAPLIVLGFVSMVCALLRSMFPNLNISTIGTRFSYSIGDMVGHGIPSALPHFSWPWSQGTSNFILSLHTIKDLIPSAFTIAMLGAIESLLSAVVADGMAHTKHNPDVELRALGIGNMLCPLFGGIPATGAIARTATNIRFGAKSPLSAAFHGVFVLIIILVFASLVSYVPMAGLSALLILVAYNMSEVKHFEHIARVGPKSDVIVLLICFVLTVVFDMVIGVTAGIMFAALLFMKRMATYTSSQIVDTSPHDLHIPVPKDVLLYDINGPLFFGAAEKAMEAIDSIQVNVKTVFLLMEDVPVMDISGLVALETTLMYLIKHKKRVYLVGVKSQPRELLLKSSVISNAENLFFCATISHSLEHLQQMQKSG